MPPTQTTINSYNIRNVNGIHNQIDLHPFKNRPVCNASNDQNIKEDHSSDTQTHTAQKSFINAQDKTSHMIIWRGELLCGSFVRIGSHHNQPAYLLVLKISRLLFVVIRTHL